MFIFRKLNRYIQNKNRINTYYNGYYSSNGRSPYSYIKNNRFTIILDTYYTNYDRSCYFTIMIPYNEEFRWKSKNVFQDRYITKRLLYTVCKTIEYLQKIVDHVGFHARSVNYNATKNIKFIN